MPRLMRSAASVATTVVFWAAAWAGVMNFLWGVLELEGPRMTGYIPLKFAYAIETGERP